MPVNRRDFLRSSVCAALGGASAYSALGTMRLLAAATAPRVAAFSDYKALVCIFLYGGNDSFNMIVPYDAPHYANYRLSRNNLVANGGLALDQAAIQANALSPLAASGGLPGGLPGDGGSYGLHPAMPELRALFNSGHAAAIANVGTLLYPITQAQFQNATVPAPPQLFSHDDQTNFWQTSRPDDSNANGWGGRIADLLYAGNTNQQLSMSISLSGENLFQRGAIVNQYNVDSGGVQTLEYLGQYLNEEGVIAFNALQAAGTQANVIERAYAAGTNRAIGNYQMISTAFQAVPPPTTQFPDTDLGRQLAMVARLIKVRGALGMNRQVFFVSTGNYDTHGDQIATQADNLGQLSKALTAFYNATAELGVENGVTAFTASDFGRSLSVNADGTDHGWGGHHLVVGGGVRGRRFYGQMPSLLTTDGGNPDDTGYGQIIPTIAIDQYAATLASWFGVDASGIGTIFPNLGRFAAPNLRFLG